MTILVLTLKAFAVTAGVVAGVIAAPFVFAFVCAALLTVLYAFCSVGDWLIDTWRSWTRTIGF